MSLPGDTIALYTSSMKQDAILKVIAKETGTSDLTKINEAFKTEPLSTIKFRMSGKKIGHFGVTAPIKNIGKEGVKVFLANKVKLIKYEDIEQFEKAKPREERPVREKKPVVAAKPAASNKTKRFESEEESEKEPQ